tara:strand:- start:45 stop:653 length:609 start_codon:yes stop_codon:yes gene_type:complete
MDVKIASVLIGVCLGWFLGQLTTLTKHYFLRKQKKDAIYTELSDLSAWLDRYIKTSEYNILLTMKGKIATNLPTKLHAFIINEYFPVICAHLPRGARLGITECISQIENLNDISNQIAALLEKPSEIKNQELINRYTSMFCSAFETKWKVDFLLENKDGDLNKLSGAAKEISSKLKVSLKEIKKKAGDKSVSDIQFDYYEKE